MNQLSGAQGSCWRLNPTVVIFASFWIFSIITQTSIGRSESVSSLYPLPISQRDEPPPAFSTPLISQLGILLSRNDCICPTVMVFVLVKFTSSIMFPGLKVRASIAVTTGTVQKTLVINVATSKEVIFKPCFMGELPFFLRNLIDQPTLCM